MYSARVYPITYHVSDDADDGFTYAHALVVADD
jgi:hypothetical protein